MFAALPFVFTAFHCLKWRLFFTAGSEDEISHGERTLVITFRCSLVFSLPFSASIGRGAILNTCSQQGSEITAKQPRLCRPTTSGSSWSWTS